MNPAHRKQLQGFFSNQKHTKTPINTIVNNIPKNNVLIINGGKNGNCIIWGTKKIKNNDYIPLNKNKLLTYVDRIIKHFNCTNKGYIKIDESGILFIVNNVPAIVTIKQRSIFIHEGISCISPYE